MSITMSKEEIKGFENILKQEQEDFEKWDDYIEWNAYIESLRDLKSKLKDIEEAKDVRIT
jgi:uncharacterized protein YeeX (DUF496 family)